MEAHLITTRDDVLEYGNIFSDLTEDQIVPESFLVRNVMVAGTRVSQNGYTYTEKAFDTLVRLADGAKVFLDHPSDAQIKATGGVRNIRDFAGVFHNTKKDGDRVYGDLYLRESAFPLFKDIIRLRPQGVGMSINARVKVYKDSNTGKESVVDIDKLYSVDAVSSASLCKSLFESVTEEQFHEIADREEKNISSRIDDQDYRELAGQTLVNFSRAVTYHHGDMSRVLNMEGIIANQIKKDKVRSEVNEFIWRAADMVYKVIRDPDMPIKDKKNKIEEIMDDLDSEIQSRLKKIKGEAMEGIYLTSESDVDDEINIIIPD